MTTLNWKDYCSYLLALVVWREARGSGFDGMCGVAFSIINRVDHPKWWGSDLAQVILKKWQYSSMTDPHDHQLTMFPVKEVEFTTVMSAVQDVLNGRIENPVPGADSYFDDSIPAPAWATPDKFVKKIGRLNFYNIDGDPGV